MAKLIKIGIECESIEESQTWGVARELTNLLKQIASRPELQKVFKFFLYFKSRIPDYEFLNNPIFIKKIVWPPLDSFSLYYYVFLPFSLWWNQLDATYFPNYMLPVLFCGKSLVSLTEDVYYEIHNNKLPFRYRVAYATFSNWAAKHATRLMAFSESSKKSIVEFFKISPNRISVNYHGVEIKNDPTIINLKFKIENYCLYVGQAFPRRHLKETLLAFEEISHDFSNLQFIAIGKDKYNPPIISDFVKEINSRLGTERIIYKEYVDENELLALYKNSRFIVYASDSEAFGFPPLEGLGYGTVPVVADAPVNHEIYGENAFFVQKPITAYTISIAMRDALRDQNKIEKIKSSAPEIIKKFNWSAHADRFIDIIKSIVHEKD
jgi:glycosyltransferase involved in cell wall biosynthesis